MKFCTKNEIRQKLFLAAFLTWDGTKTEIIGDQIGDIIFTKLHIL